MHDKPCNNFVLTIGSHGTGCVICGHIRVAHNRQAVFEATPVGEELIIADEPPEEKQFTFTVNAKQMYIIRAALDLYARMGMGQLDVAVGEFLQRHFSEQVHRHVMTENLDHDPTFVPTPVMVRHIVTTLINELKKVVFGHPPNGSWGIFNEKVPEACREAYDIRQMVGRALHAHRMEECKDEEERKLMTWDTDARSYIPTNLGEEAVSIEVAAPVHEETVQEEADRLTDCEP